MKVVSNKDRLKCLSLLAFNIGQSILFCPECIWQAEGPGIAMGPICPDCGARLHLITVDDELISMCEV
jgi:hypothetical protein